MEERDQGSHTSVARKPQEERTGRAWPCRCSCIRENARGWRNSGGCQRGIGETLEGSWVTAEVDGTLKGDGDTVVT